MLKKLTAVLLLVLLLVGCAGGGAAVSSSTPEESKPAVSSQVESKPVSSQVEVSSQAESSVSSTVSEPEEVPEVSVREQVQTYLKENSVVEENVEGAKNAVAYRMNLTAESYLGKPAFYQWFDKLGAKVRFSSFYYDDSEVYNMYGEGPDFLSAEYDFPLDVIPVHEPFGKDRYGEWEWPTEIANLDLLMTLKDGQWFGDWPEDYPATVTIYSYGYYDSPEEANLLFSGELHREAILYLSDLQIDLVEDVFLMIDVTIEGLTYRAYTFFMPRQSFDDAAFGIMLNGTSGILDENGNFVEGSTCEHSNRLPKITSAELAQLKQNNRKIEVTDDQNVLSKLPVDVYFTHSGDELYAIKPIMTVVAKQGTNCKVRIMDAESMLNQGWQTQVGQLRNVYYTGEFVSGEFMSFTDNFRFQIWDDGTVYTVVGQFISSDTYQICVLEGKERTPWL